MLQIKNLCLLLMLAFLTSACAKTTFVRSALNYEDELVKCKSMVMLPPNLEINQVDVAGKKTRLDGYEDHLEELILEVFLEKMHNKGYNTRLISRREMAEAKLEHDAANTNDEFSDLMVDLYKDGPWKEGIAHSLNRTQVSVVSLANKVHADLVLIMDFYGTSHSKGAVALNFVFDLFNNGSSKNLTEFWRARIAILNGKTGKVLWANSVIRGDDAMTTTFNSFSKNDKVDTQNLNELFDNALSDLPNAK